MAKSYPAAVYGDAVVLVARGTLVLAVVVVVVDVDDVVESAETSVVVVEAVVDGTDCGPGSRVVRVVSGT